MRSIHIRLRNELIPINLLGIVLIIVIILLPPNFIRVLLALPFLFYFPGYTLVAALFPGKERLGTVQRIVFSLGLSIVAVSFIGLILNYLPRGVRLEPVLFSVTVFTFASSLVAWLRRRKLSNQEEFDISFQLSLPGWGGSTGNRVLSIALIVAIIGALGVLAYSIASPKAGKRYTEFYLTGEYGKAGNYPTELRLNETGRILMNIVNQEHVTASYRIEVKMDGIKTDDIGPIVLESGSVWKSTLSVSPTATGDNQELEFFLYKDDGPDPYLEPLRLWIHVTP